ncbi:hypothetical protein CBM2637_A70116 [Cupriavidus taiwanensis]|nr:hypothetical protein CBM2637_A70116 [Cupriavidus taiwanensis]
MPGPLKVVGHEVVLHPCATPCAASLSKKPRTLTGTRLSLETGGESGTRTPDLRIMIPSL